MASQRQCSTCGTVMPTDAPKGLCPRCLFAAALRPGPPSEQYGETDSDGGKPWEALQPMERIDRYKVVKKIGEGGCGVVYLAEQMAPVKRQVALKVIKPGMDTRQVIARFEAERQVLAVLDHPHIAKVLDGGATRSGRPYFVMELVKGVRVTDYCDQQCLSTKERLAVFTQICDAIQHAHQKGIIHRDIKPSNILVGTHDAKPTPKVIDFGIAKATEQPLTEATLITAAGQLMGTPAYMSPEQAEARLMDVDTRTDIYALGVLLYELLTGSTPFDGRELINCGADELRRRIREEEPPRPSTRLSTMSGVDLTRVAMQRRSEPAQLTRFVRGDLDWIVMKCLEKDRTRRYETAASISTEIARHLNNEPVLACPPSKLYRAGKLLRRYRVLATGGAVVTFSLLAGLGSAMWSLEKEKEARKRADEAEQRSRAREETAWAAQQQAEQQLRTFYEGQISRDYPPGGGPPESPIAPLRSPARRNADRPSTVPLPPVPDLNRLRLNSVPIDSGRSNDVEAVGGPIYGGGVSRMGESSATSAADYVVPHSETNRYDYWAGVWWQWSLGLPWETPDGITHPNRDSPHFRVDQGQRGDVWFLAAPFGQVTRHVTIPRGTTLFFALLNAEVSNLDNDPIFFAATEDDMAYKAAALADHIGGLFCQLNGEAIPEASSYRFMNAPIDFWAPTPWIFGVQGGFGTSVGDGYYLMLRPLPPGKHTLRYGGAFLFSKPRDTFDLIAPMDIIYEITVR